VTLDPLLAAVDGATVDAADGLTTVDVPPAAWTAAVQCARDDLGCDVFDFLSAVDEGDRFTLVCHLVSSRPFAHLALRTALAKDGAGGAGVGSVAALYAGAGWHERETAEMFGIAFLGPDGQPLDLPALLLPAELVGHPLRKDFALQARLDTPWPGAKEPGGGR
jgi:NADH-quinone oxidoreductase subunit C